MKRSHARHVGVVAGLVVVAASFGGCSYSDPPAEAMETRTYTIGPFNLGPAGSPTGRATGMAPMEHPPGAIAVKAVHWHVRDAEGNDIPNTDHRIHFHHVVAYSNKQRDQGCSRYSSSAGERWAAPGSERTDLELPNGYAYFVEDPATNPERKDTWRGNYDIMNETGEEIDGIHVDYDVTYTTDRSSLHPVTPYWFDLNDCPGNGQYTVPGGGEPGSIDTRTKRFVLPKDGKLVAVRGHMHDRGIDVTLTDGAGNVLCRAAAVYDDGSDGAPHPAGDGDGGMDHGGDGRMDHGNPSGHTEGGPRVIAIPLCKDLAVPITAGQEVFVTARYHNEERLTDAMGKMLLYVAEDEPTPDPAPPADEPPAEVPPSEVAALTAD
jgi:hypothetical protein